MRPYLLLVALLLVPAVFASLTEQVDITIYENNTVEKQVTLTLVSTVERNNYSFPLYRGFTELIYNGTYWIENGNLVFNQSIKPGTNIIAFTLLMNDSIRRDGPHRIYGTSFNTSKDTSLSVSLRLPPGFVLADANPAVSPAPTSIITDGRSVVITWKSFGPLNVVVFYERPQTQEEIAANLSDNSSRDDFTIENVSAAISNSAAPLIFSLIALFVVVLVVAFFFLRRKQSVVLMDTLSQDEQAVVEFIRDGLRTQKQIATQAGFSKSKMSKVVRKLEEKKVVRKEPHFKTNRLELFPEWKKR